MESYQGSANNKTDFKDLEPLLRRSFNNNDLQVVEYTTTKLLPVGENFGSILIKIDAKIRENKNAKEEMLYFAGKTPSCPEKPLIEWPLIFQKELFMYAELFPLYRELEKEAGVEESDLIDILPKYIGYRNSLKYDSKIDENSVLLMENIKVKGYYNGNKRLGLDVHHARKALTSLARYHALGIVMKQKRPAFAKKAIDQARILGIDWTPFNDGFASIHEILKKSPCLKKHASVIESSFEQTKDGGTWKTEPTEPWASLTHGDFWTNNILFHKDHEGNVDDVKFVDFQGYLHHSPLKDLPYFLGASVDVETQTNHLEELLELYYDVFVKTLKRMSCDTSPFTRQSFDRELKVQAINEFPLSALAIKFFVSEIVDEGKSNEELINNVLIADPSDVFVDRLMWLMEIYERMKWL